MSLEAYVAECHYDLDKKGMLAICKDKSHSSNPALECNICSIIKSSGVSWSEYALNDEVKNIAFLRNQYVHYDFEIIDGDTLSHAVAKNELQLKPVLDYFKSIYDDGTVKRGNIYSTHNLFPFGFLSSDFCRWIVEHIRNTISQISQTAGTRMPSFRI